MIYKYFYLKTLKLSKLTKLKFFILIALLSLSLNANAAFDIKARTAILQDYLSGEILYEKVADKSI